MDIVFSINKIPIRVTEERWLHIIDSHNDLAGFYDDILLTIESPDFVVKGYANALIANRKIEHRHLSVVYKEVSKKDGFVITAYFTSKPKLKKGEILWRKR